jgi:Spy/CpxP family protein refolding chaperone
MNLAGVLAIVGLATAGISIPSVAQQHGGHHGHHGHQAKGGHGQYAGQQARDVASLSDEEVTGHLDGRGLGYARPAELNGYPGPMHVLELEQELALSQEQVSATTALFQRMQSRAREAGRAYIEAEKAVDAAFRSGHADARQIAELVRAADLRRAEKRLAHLDAHLEMARLLSADQRKRYAELRGYEAPRSK